MATDLDDFDFAADFGLLIERKMVDDFGLLIERKMVDDAHSIELLKRIAVDK